MTHTIMVVDDDLDDLELTKRIMAKMRPGAALVSALHGEAALELLQGGRELPSLILADLKMPGMNGIDLLRRLRADERLKDIPVVMVTNSTLDSDRREALAAGANDFLHKAFDLDRYAQDLLVQVKRWVKP